jgi:hypothetical protein
MKLFIFTLWMKVGQWIFDSPIVVIKRHKGVVRGFTMCMDEWYADKIMEIKKNEKTEGDAKD